MKLGYDLMSEDDGHLKDYFLYLAEFPKDCVISFERILWHWMGEGIAADTFLLLKKLLS